MSLASPLCVLADFRLPSGTVFQLTPEDVKAKPKERRTDPMLGARLGLAHADGSLRPFQPRRLSDLEPSSLIRELPDLQQLAQARAALTAAKGPLGCEKAVRNKLFAGLGDEPTRYRVRYKLGLPTERRLSAADLFRPGPDGDALRQRLEQLVLEGEGLESQRPYMQDLLQLSRIYPGSEEFEFAFKALGAIVLQSLDRDWVRVMPDKAGIDAMIAQLDVALTAGCRRVMHHPEYLAFEGVWRAVRLLVAEGRSVVGVSCSAWDLVERKPALLAAAAAEKPSAVALLHPIDPRVHGALVRDVASTLGVPCVFQAHDTVCEALGDPRARPAVLAQWTAARGSAHAKLCLSKVLSRLPFGYASVPVKEFNYEEVSEGEVPDPWLSYGPAAGIVAALLDGGSGPRPFQSLPLHQYLIDDTVMTAPTVLPAKSVLTEVASSFDMYQLEYRIAGGYVRLAAEPQEPAPR